MNQININLPAIRNIAVRGVRRTAIFMGLGINAANNPDFKQYELAKLTGFEFIEPISDERTLAGLKTEFGRWIVGNGLRELIETFCIFLDEIHVACLWMSASCHKIPLNQIQTQDKKFRHKGLKDKLPHLKNTYNVTLTQPDFMISINQARHCLTHRQGSVGARDCLDSERLVVSWRGCEIYAETPSGEIISLSPMPDVGVSLSEGSKIIAEVLDRTRTFPLNSIVTFSPRELAEICNYTLIETNEVLLSTEKYAKKSGITLERPDSV